MFFSTGMWFLPLLVIITLVKRLRRKTKLEAIALCFLPLMGHGAIVESSRAIAFLPSSVRAHIGEATRGMSSQHPIQRCANTHKPARETCSRYSRNRAFEVMTFSPRYGRSGNRRLTFLVVQLPTDISNASWLMAQVGYITRLACVLPESKQVQAAA